MPHEAIERKELLSHLSCPIIGCSSADEVLVSGSELLLMARSSLCMSKRVTCSLCSHTRGITPPCSKSNSIGTAILGSMRWDIEQQGLRCAHG